MQAINKQPGTLERVESLLEFARESGYRVRHDHFDGTGGGVCTFAGQKWIFMDVSLSAAEQLQQLEELLPADSFKTDLNHTPTPEPKA